MDGWVFLFGSSKAVETGSNTGPSSVALIGGKCHACEMGLPGEGVLLAQREGFPEDEFVLGVANGLGGHEVDLPVLVDYLAVDQEIASAPEGPIDVLARFERRPDRCVAVDHGVAHHATARLVDEALPCEVLEVYLVGVSSRVFEADIDLGGVVRLGLVAGMAGTAPIHVGDI